jgi:hypothetical protein
LYYVVFGRYNQPNSAIPGVSNPAPVASPFGSSIFGAPAGGQQQPSGFGGFGAASGSVMAGSNGTTSLAAPSTPYATTNDYENNINIKLLAISAMPAYRNRSLEVSRLNERNSF